MRRYCENCGCTVHGAYHYGSYKVCRLVTELRAKLELHHAHRSSAEKNSNCWVCIKWEKENRDPA